MPLSFARFLRPTVHAGWVAASVLTLTLGLPAMAAPVMPTFATAPAGWVTDRYDAVTFGNVGAYAGRNDVLGIGINSSTDLANRSAGFQSTFYNTQGRQTAISGGAGSVLAADLFIESGWEQASNGLVRTDMWGVMANANDTTLAYPIIGFTNFGGAARLRVFDADVGWVNLANVVAFGAWTALAIEFDGDSFDFFVNGALVYSDMTISAATTGFNAAIMQAYNFADPALGTNTTTAYTAHWSNAVATAVPEPTSVALVAAAMAGVFAARRRKPA